MLCPYIRSSSINQFKTCEMRYFFEYVLGMKSPTGKKACLGTIFHKVFEIRSLAKIAIQNNHNSINDDNLGYLTVEQCKNYKLILDKAFNHYKNLEIHLDFDDKDKATILKWIKNTLHTWPTYDPFKMNVVSAELFFDIEIKKDWAKFNGIISGQEIIGHLRIKGTMDMVVDLGNDVYELVDYKGLPVDTPIPTPNGWTTMDELVVGDVVFDQYGKKTRVTNKSTKKFKECYEITFDDKSKVICDDEHYWKLSDGSVAQIKDLKINNKICVAKSIECENVKLPIDPYVLGIWLGDGRNRSGEVTSGDKFVFQEIKKRKYQLGESQEKRDKNCETRTILGLTTKLRKENLLHNKHIPEIYLRASYNQRLDLLRGLMDSDGSVNKLRKQCVFMNCTKKLSEDVKELLLSLGQRPLLNNTTQPYKDRIVYAYPVSFRPIDINPFLLPVKRDKVDKKWGTGQSHIRKIKKIEKIGLKLTQCITVDSPDSTYLCTRNFIPTHNTGQHRKDFATGEEKTLEYLEGDVQLLLYLIALKEIFPDKNFILSLLYINAGGLFSVPVDDSMYEKAWNMLEKSFKEISKTYNPKQLDATHKDWRCKYLCPFAKSADYTDGKSICQHFKNLISKEGLVAVANQNVDMKTFGKYSDGGGRKEVETK